MTVKQRGQSLRINDTVKLKLFVYNGSEPADVESIEKVDIYRLNATEATAENPTGRLLVESLTSITQDDEGQYSVDVPLTSPKYTIDQYSDEWSIVFNSDLPIATSEQFFTIRPNAWFVDSRPIVHDFEFNYSPNKIVKGSKRYITIEVTPNVPHNTDKLAYYKNLVSAGTLYVSIEQACGPCLPEEEDLRLTVDREEVTERDLCVGYYFLDTSEMDCGIYYISFELALGANTYVSDKQPLQIFK